MGMHTTAGAFLPTGRERRHSQGGQLPRRSGTQRKGHIDMIINKLTPLWTEEQQRKFNELTDKYNSLFDETPTEEITDIWATAREIDEQRNEIIHGISEQYIKSFARRKTAIYDDIREIVNAIEKEDYLNAVKYDAFTVVSGKGIDDYQKCFHFIDTQLIMQFRVIVHYNLDRAKMKQIIDDKVSQWYINNHPDYIPTAHGRATDELVSISSRETLLDDITGTANIQRENFRLSIVDYQNIKGALGVSTHKLLMYGVGQFTRTNSRNTRQNSNLQVSFFLKDYARLLGYKVDELPGTDPEKEQKRVKNVLHEAHKEVKKDLDLLFAMQLQWQENIKGKAKDFDNVRILGRVAIRKGVVTMEFTKSMGDYLKALPITQFPVTQYRIDGRNRNAYALGNKFATHYSNDNNQKKGTANRLKVENLLKCCPELPTIEQVIKDRNRWEDRIKERFENALDEVTRAGTIKNWTYTHAKGVELTEEEARNITDYSTFKNLYITFEMGAHLDHTERLERQDAKKEARKKTSRKK